MKAKGPPLEPRQTAFIETSKKVEKEVVMIYTRAEVALETTGQCHTQMFIS